MCYHQKKLTNHEKIFINAVDEMMWTKAAGALREMGNLSIDEVIADNDLEDSTLAFAASAPAEESAALLVAVPDLESTRDLRKATISAHAAACLSLLSSGDHRASLHIGSCCSLYRNGSGLDLTLSDFAKTLAEKTAEVDRPAAMRYPQVQVDPSLPAPEMLNVQELPTRHFGADCLSLLARGLFESGAPSGLVVSIVEAAFSGCHWPTWRSFGWLDRDLASAVLSRIALTEGARAHLVAIRDGRLFELCADRHW